MIIFWNNFIPNTILTPHRIAIKAKILQESVKVAAMQCADKKLSKVKVFGMQIACKLRAEFLLRAAIR